MPRGDGTGPAGMGSMTGRAAGFCAGYPVAGFMNPAAGRGMAYGFGRGRGFGFRSGRGYGARYAPMDYVAPVASSEVDALKAQAQGLEQALEEIKSRISALEKNS